MPGGTTYSRACRSPSMVVGKHRSSSSHTVALDAAVSPRCVGNWVRFEFSLGLAAPETGRLPAPMEIGFGFEFRAPSLLSRHDDGVPVGRLGAEIGLGWNFGLGVAVL